VRACISSRSAKVTTLGRKKKGDLVNLEADVIAKHLAYLVRRSESHAAVTG
jgi:riboflavin synthase alpha subunit